MRSIGFEDLKNVPILRELSKDTLAALDSIAQKRKFQAREYVVKRGELASSAFIIIRGVAEVFKQNEEGRKEIIVLLGPGDVIGLGDKLQLSKSWTRSADVMAAESMLLYEFDLTEYEQLTQQYSDLDPAFRKIALRSSHYFFIKKLCPFAAFDYRKVRAIAEFLDEVTLEKGVAIIREGDESDFCYFILSGEVEVTHEKNGDVQRLALLGSGDIFGESSILTSVRRRATVTTTQECRLLKVNGQEIKKILYKSSDVSRFFFTILRKNFHPNRLSTVELQCERREGLNARYILKNNANLTYYQLSADGIFIWNLLDGKHSIADLLLEFSEKFHFFSMELIIHLLYDFSMLGFIQPPFSSSRIGQSTRPKNRAERFFTGLKRWMNANYSVSFETLDEWLNKAFFRILLPIFNEYTLVFLSIVTILGAPLLSERIAAVESDIANFTPFFIATLGLALAGFNCLVQFLAALFRLSSVIQSGRKVNCIGAARRWFFLYIYVDTTEMILASAKKKIFTALSGNASYLILGGAMAILGLTASTPWVKLFCFFAALIQYSTLLVELNPIFNLSGYRALSTAIGLPSISSRSIFPFSELFSENQGKPYKSKLVLYLMSCLLFIVIASAYSPYVYQMLSKVLNAEGSADYVHQTFFWVLAGFSALFPLGRLFNRNS